MPSWRRRLVAAVEDRDLFLSALTLGEIRRGIEDVRRRDPAKAGALEHWLRDVSGACGRTSAARSVPGIDVLLAAAAQRHDLVLVTRNTAGFSGPRVRTLNPFDEARA